MGKTKNKTGNKPDIPKLREGGTGIEPVLTAEQRQAEKLYLNGKKISEIAAVLGCNPRKIYTWIAKFGWKERRVQIEKTPEYIQGVLLQKLAQEVEGISRKTGISTVDADKIVKIVSAIKSLRRETDKLGNIILTMTEFMGFITGKDRKLADRISNYLGEFTQEMVEKYG